MGHRIIVVLLVGGIFLSNLISLSFAADPIRIGIIGDQTGAPVLNDLTGPYQILNKGVGLLNQQSLQAVIHTGDLVESTLLPATITEDFNKGSTILNSLNVNWYLSAGDHDVNPPTFDPDSPDHSRETLFKQLYSKINPKVASNLYYSFDVGSHHFIALYSEEELDTDSRWGNVFLNNIADDQFQWLKGDLQANASNPGIVVFMHQPLWYNWTNWARVHNLLKQYPVIAVVAGHFHYNQEAVGALDGIQYWVVGATGGKTKTGTPNAGDLHHVTVMTINGKDISFNPLPITEPNMSFTTRQHMDRIEAMDQVLGNLWNFASLNPVYLKNGEIVNDCASGNPAQLKLAGLGNPTDIPITMSLELLADAPSIKIKSGQFINGYCIADIGPYNCQLRANKWVGVSNTSIVQMAFGKETAVLWNGELEVVGSPPVTKQNIKLRVKLSYRDASSGNNYMIYQDGVTSLSACP